MMSSFKEGDCGALAEVTLMRKGIFAAAFDKGIPMCADCAGAKSDTRHLKIGHLMQLSKYRFDNKHQTEDADAIIGRYDERASARIAAVYEAARTAADKKVEMKTAGAFLKCCWDKNQKDEDPSPCDRASTNLEHGLLLCGMHSRSNKTPQLITVQAIAHPFIVRSMMSKLVRNTTVDSGKVKRNGQIQALLSNLANALGGFGGVDHKEEKADLKAAEPVAHAAGVSASSSAMSRDESVRRKRPAVHGPGSPSNSPVAADGADAESQAGDEGDDTIL